MTMRVGPQDDPDRYELLEPRSRGGEGQLWRGILPLDGVPLQVAIKIVNPQSVPDMAAWRIRWQRQADLLRSVDHRGLVKVREVFEGPLPHGAGRGDPSSRTLYLIMEWADGENLEQWVGARPGRDFGESVAVLRSVAAALDYLHSGPVGGRPMVHRDIKPANVLVAGGQSKLVDFGFARLEGSTEVTFAGTPAYMAPEVIAGHLHDAASDRFGLGATVYFAVTGQAPSMTDYQAMKRRIDAAPGSRPGAAERLLTMLHPDPRRRPVNAAAWIDSLLAGGTPGTVVRDRRPVVAPSPEINDQVDVDGGQRDRVRNTQLVVGGVVAAVFLLVIAGVALAGGGSSGEKSGDPVQTSVTTASSTSTTVTILKGTMPSVVGQPQAVAQSLLRDQGASDSDVIITERPSPDVPGIVIEQSPLSGRPLSSPIRLTVSTGPGASSTTSSTTSTSTTTTTTARGPGSTLAPAPATMYLADLNPVSGTNSSRSSSLGGQRYSRSVVQSFCTGCADVSVEYSIGRQYRIFHAIVGMNDDNREAAARATFELYAVDGTPRLLWSSAGVAANGVALGSAISTGDINVEGVLRVRLVVRGTNGSGYATWADASVAQ